MGLHASRKKMAESKYSIEFLNKAHKETFESKKIFVWTDKDSIKGKTALCRNCGIDSVLDDEFPIEDKEFINQMNKLWFQI